MAVILKASKSTILSGFLRTFAAQASTFSSPPIGASSTRHFSCSGTRRLKEIRETEQTSSDGKVEIVIEGVIKESDRKAKLVHLPPQPASSQMNCSQNSNCHPLCKLDFVQEVKHTGKSYIDGSCAVVV